MACLSQVDNFSNPRITSRGNGRIRNVIRGIDKAVYTLSQLGRSRRKGCALHSRQGAPTGELWALMNLNISCRNRGYRPYSSATLTYLILKSRAISRLPVQPMNNKIYLSSRCTVGVIRIIYS